MTQAVVNDYCICLLCLSVMHTNCLIAPSLQIGRNHRVFPYKPSEWIESEGTVPTYLHTVSRFSAYRRNLNWSELLSSLLQTYVRSALLLATTITLPCLTIAGFLRSHLVRHVMGSSRRGYIRMNAHVIGTGTI